MCRPTKRVYNPRTYVSSIRRLFEWHQKESNLLETVPAVFLIGCVVHMYRQSNTLDDDGQNVRLYPRKSSSKEICKLYTTMAVIGKFHECLIHCNYFYVQIKHFLHLLYYSLSASWGQLQTEFLCVYIQSCLQVSLAGK